MVATMSDFDVLYCSSVVFCSALVAAIVIGPWEPVLRFFGLRRSAWALGKVRGLCWAAAALAAVFFLVWLVRLIFFGS